METFVSHGVTYSMTGFGGHTRTRFPTESKETKDYEYAWKSANESNIFSLLASMMRAS